MQQQEVFIWLELVGAFLHHFLFESKILSEKAFTQHSPDHPNQYDGFSVIITMLLLRAVLDVIVVFRLHRYTHTHVHAKCKKLSCVLSYRN